MKTSIALATYNGEKYINEQLLSFISQTIKPNEIIVSDDNSTDRTLDIVRAVAKDNPAINFVININPSNLGYSQNFNKALAMCSGDIIFLADQDDVWYERKIEFILAIFNKNKALKLVIHDLMFCDSHLQRQGQTKLQRLERISSVEATYVVGMATALCKEFLNLCLPIPNYKEISHDAWLHRCASALGVKYITSEVLADYRRHEANATSGLSINSAEKMSFKHYVKIKLDKSSRLKNLLMHKVNIEQLVLWLSNNEEELIVKELATKALLIEKLNLLNAEQYHIKCRILALEKSFFPRAAMVLSNYCFGRYKFFSGIKSAIKDLI